MKILTTLLTFFAILPISAASAQMLANTAPSQPQITSPQITEETASSPNLVSEDSQTEASKSEVEIVAPSKISEEQLTAADDELRENLRDTTKNDDRKSRIKFLEVNNYVDKVQLKRDLQKKGLNFQEANYLANQLPKPKVNPDSNKQMNDYIFERANVKEKQQPTKDTTNAQ